MKRIFVIIILVIGIILIFAISKVKAENYLPLLGKVIVIDPGQPSYLSPNVEV